MWSAFLFMVNGGAIMSEPKAGRDMPMLDRIHLLFLVYSAAHNFVNAFVRANNFFLFLFVVVGILCVELMLWSIYHHWKDGRLVGSMRTMGLWAGAIAMFYATAGILAQASTGSGADWVTFHHAYILPTSAPMMFIFAFLIQSVDPIANADRDALAHAHLVGVEEQREVLHGKEMALANRKSIRELKAGMQRSRLEKLRKEADSRITQRTLKNSARAMMPELLQSINVKSGTVPGFWKRMVRGTYALPATADKVEDAKIVSETVGGDGSADAVGFTVNAGKRGKP